MQLDPLLRVPATRVNSTSVKCKETKVTNYLTKPLNPLFMPIWKKVSCMFFAWLNRFMSNHSSWILHSPDAMSHNLELWNRYVVITIAETTLNNR